MMKKFQLFSSIITFWLFMGITEFVKASSDDSSASETPGFRLVGGLLTLGIIAFAAPFLRREKLEENNN